MKENEFPAISEHQLARIPKTLDPASGYTAQQKEQILTMFAVYSEVVYFAGIVTGFGSELDAPEYGMLEKLLDIKKKADRLPSQLRDMFPEPFQQIESAINYCSKKH
jgi:hypothetical protein